MQMHNRMLLHMDHTNFISDVEAALAEAKISVATMCRRADLAQSTWHRWKLNGVAPRDSSRTRVLTALTGLGVSFGQSGRVAA